MSLNKDLGEALLQERPEEYGAFIDQEGRKREVNIAGAHVAKHSLGDEAVETFAEILSDQDVYAGDIDVQSKVKETSIKAKVYERIKDEVEDESEADARIRGKRRNS